MKQTRTTAIAATLAAATCLAVGSTAQADVVFHYPGTYVFSSGGGQSVTTDAIDGTLTGIRVTFTYQYNGGSSAPYDAAFTVGMHQWGGYYPLINGAEIGQTPTGAPIVGTNLTYNSGNLGMGYNQTFNHQGVRIGFGNGNFGGACTLSDVTITLLGVVPSPGAAAALALGGLTTARRRNRS